MADSTDFKSIAEQFTNFYYTQFDQDRKLLAGLYKENSMLTFESADVFGSVSIIEKLASLPFQKIIHKISTLDAQPTPSGWILILVTGALLVDEEQKPMNYSQTFQLAPDGAGSYFILNDIFKLIYG
ncbi:hypothetical protein B0O99DRAFT_614298 [Bisporella sp. PMI_857]|nr:hypothetical protein B0O99DRAFT_614298 [Bisporella sp. PMI_857]